MTILGLQGHVLIDVLQDGQSGKNAFPTGRRETKTYCLWGWAAYDATDSPFFRRVQRVSQALYLRLAILSSQP